MRYGILFLVYLALLLFHFQPLHSLHAQAYFCQQHNCSAVLESFLEGQPEARCIFYDVNEPSVLSMLQHHEVILPAEKGLVQEVIVQRKGLLHHKFCVGNNAVFTGSWNPTIRGTYHNDNYVLVLQDKKAVDFYQGVYDYILYGTTVSSSPFSNAKLLACPVHNCRHQVLQEIRRTRSSIDLLSFTFTDREIAQALYELDDAGVVIRIVQEKRQAHLTDIDDVLRERSILRYDGNWATMHGKVWILDNTTLILGSWNPTKAGSERNDENILIIRDADLAQLFYKEFERIWDLAS